jgi:hypothetical protein
MVATFQGNLSEAISGAPIAGAEVDVVVTQPDSTIDAFTVLTDVSGNFSTTRNYALVGDYTVNASYPGNADYNKFAIQPVTFTVTPAKKDVTLTLNVTVS